ncbi:MAG: hypothetical protein ACREMF_01770, partial [Gemmatimonadales bacterium]
TEGMAELARTSDPSFKFVPNEAHYDGVYMYAIARDPLARQEEFERIDRAVYRYGHPGYAWLARLGAWARPRLIPHSLMAIGIAGLVAGSFLVSAIATRAGRTGWAGLAVAVNPGLLFALVVDTAEPVGVALAVAGVLLWLRDRILLALPFLAFACLVKEPFVLVPVGLAGWELVQRLRGRPAPHWARRILLAACAGIPIAAWYVSLRLRFDAWPFADAPEGLDLPVMGWIDSFRLGARYALSGGLGSQIGAATTPVLVGVGVLLAVGAIRAITLRTPFDAMYLLFWLLALCMNPLGLVFEKDLVRLLSVTFLLLPAVLVPWPQWRGGTAHAEAAAVLEAPGL